MPSVGRLHARNNGDNFIKMCMRAAPSDSSTQLESLQEQAHTHVLGLRSELLDLLNTEYAGFIGLSSNLVGTNDNIDKLRSQAAMFRQRMGSANEHVHQLVGEFEEKLVARKSTQEKYAMLLLLQEVHSTVEMLKRMLASDNNVPGNQHNGHHQDLRQAYHNNLREMEASDVTDPSERGALDTAKLERAGRYLARLNILMQKGSAFGLVKNVAGAVRVLTGRLHEQMDYCLLELIASPGAAQTAETAAAARTAQTAGTEHEETSAAGSYAARLTQLLRTYIVLDQCTRAEDLVQVQVVLPLVKEYLNKDKIMKVSLSSKDKDGMAGVYTQLRQDVRRKLAGLIRLSQQRFPLHFHFLTNSVWTSIQEALCGLGTLLFAPGLPDMFQRHYMQSMAFMAELETWCVDPSVFRNFPATRVFKNRWKTQVYYTLRLQQAATKLEMGLKKGLAMSEQGQRSAIAPQGQGSAPQGQQGEGGQAGEPFPLRLEACAALREAMAYCWSDTVWIPELTPRLFGLCLRLLARFNEWLAVGASATTPPSSSIEPGVGVDARAGGDGQWTLTGASLDELVMLHSDVQSLANGVIDELMNAVEACMQSGSTSQQGVFVFAAESRSLMRSSLLGPLEELSRTPKLLLTEVTRRLTESCCSALVAVKRIKSTYTMTGKKAPTECGTYVSSILKPLYEQVVSNERFGSVLQPSALASVCEATAQQTCSNYLAITASLLIVVDATEQSLRRLHQSKDTKTAPKGDRGNSSKLSDSDKIRMQLMLDLTKFGELLALLETTVPCDLSASKLNIQAQIASVDKAIGESSE